MHILKMVYSVYFVKSTPPKAISELMHGRYVTDILNMCITKFNTENNIF